MKKSQFAILIGVVVLCACGIFGYVKYRLDKQEVNNNSSDVNSNGNNQEINNNVNNTVIDDDTDDNTVLSKAELEEKMSNYANKNLSNIEKKFNLTKSFNISNEDSSRRSVYASYMINGVVFASDFYAGIIENYNEFQIGQRYKSFVDDMNKSNRLKVFDLKSESNESYLTIRSGFNVYIYNKNGKKAETIETNYSGSYYFISDNTHPLNKFDNTISNDNIRIGNDYILTIGSGNNNVVVTKYTIDSLGSLQQETIQTYSWDEVSCVMCK